MTMNSLDLMPRLLELPKGPDEGRRTTREHLMAMVNTDRGVYAAEQAAAASFGLWTIFDNVNVDDDIARAYEAQYPGLAEDHSLHDHWQEMMARGDESMTGFVNGIKGKAAEFGAADQLREAGWTNVEIAADPNQPVFDIAATPPGGGEAIQWQVKVGGLGYSYEVQGDMAEAPDVLFAVSSEIYDRVAESTPETVDRMMDIGPAWEFTEGINDGLETLTGNLGIDVPDSLGDILPYAGAIIAGARLLYGVVRTEMEFKEADRTTRNKIQVVTALTLMARMGITSVLSAAGASGGALAGSVIPGVGNAVGALAGTGIAGIGGWYLNRRLQPHMLRLGLDICGLEETDLFYFKNKSRVDRLAVSFQGTANRLAAA